MARILLIDDDITLLTRLSLQLEEEGHKVLKMSEAQSAKVMFAEHQPDLVVLEVKMNRGAGWDLLHDFSPQTPVIVLSANGREDDVVRGLQAGAVDYIAKPYRSTELLTRIRMRLNGNHAHEHDNGQPTAPYTQHPAAYQKPTSPNNHNHAPLGSPPTEEHTPSSTSFGVDTDNQSAFMPETEEIMLLRANTASLAEELTDTALPEDLSLGRRLHMARRHRRITLVQAENELKISMSYLQAMEDEKFSLVPQSSMGTKMLSDYADYLGLDPTQILLEYERFHRRHIVEPTSVRGPMLYPMHTLPKWAWGALAVILALAVSFSAIFFFDLDGIKALGDTVQQIILDNPPTATPTPLHETPSPSHTPTSLPSLFSSPTPTTLSEAQPVSQPSLSDFLSSPTASPISNPAIHRQNITTIPVEPLSFPPVQQDNATTSSHSPMHTRHNSYPMPIDSPYVALEPSPITHSAATPAPTPTGTPIRKIAGTMP